MGSPIARARSQSFLTANASYQDSKLTSVKRRSHSAYQQIQRLLFGLSILTGTGLALAIAIPAQASTSLIAQTSATPIPQAESTTSYLFVSPVQGNDSGTGTQTAPLRSLTQALRQAQPGTTIVLSPGTYGEETGEQFPIRLRAGITVQGNRDSHGNGIVIRGGGSFLSPTAARQNITVLAVNQSTLAGVTVTNPNSRGYGVWVESSSPTLLYNSFRDNLHDGVAVNGNSAPLIQSNLFLNNGTNGVSVFGRSSPRVQQNVFDRTGYGIYIGDEAQPTLVSNRIVNNRSGVIVQEQARPVLRHNLIEGNQQNGVVAIAQALPDLGTPDSPGHNQFAQNGEADINAEVAQYPIVAVGNQFAQQRLTGSVDLTGTMSLAAAQGATPLSLESGTATLSTASAGASERAVPTQTSTLAASTLSVPSSSTRLSAATPVLETVPVLPSAQALPLAQPTQTNVEADTVQAEAIAPTSMASPSPVRTQSPNFSIPDTASSRFPQPSRSSTPQSSQPTNRPGALAIEEFVTPSTQASAASSRVTLPTRTEAALSESAASSGVSPSSSGSSQSSSPASSAYVERLLAQFSAANLSSPARSESAEPSSSDLSQDVQAEGAIELRVIDPPESATRTTLPTSASTSTPRPESRRNAALLSLFSARSTLQTPDSEGIPIRVVMPSEQTSQPQLTTIAAAQSSPPAQATPQPTIRPRNQNLLPVPAANVPYGHVGGRSRVRVGSNPLSNRIGPGVNRIEMLGLRYRVLVEANGRDAETIVRAIAPGAFRTNASGRSLMQAGAYSSLENANDMARQLAGRGLRAEVQQMQ